MKKAVKGQYSTFVHVERLPDGQVCVVASHPVLPGCTVYGTPDENVLGRLDRAREMYLADVQKRGEPVPPPDADQPQQIIWYSDLPNAPTPIAVTV
jgi:hypothetical protein